MRVFNISPDIHGVLEGESMVGTSIRGILNLWYNEGITGTSDRASHKSLWPILPVNYTGIRTAENRQWRDTICKALSSGNSDLHIYAKQVPRSDTTQISVRRDDSYSRIPQFAHSSSSIR